MSTDPQRNGQDAPATPDTSGTADAPSTPDTSSIPATSGTADTPATPTPQDAPATPDTSSTPNTPSPGFHGDGRSMRARMEAGDPYIAIDAELGEMSTRAQLLTERYNATSITEHAERRALLEDLLGSVGEDVVIRPPFHVDYGRYISIGAGTFANFGLTVLDISPITIGRNCQIAPHVQLLAATHPLEPGPRRDAWEGGGPITIGDNVWLGAGVIVGANVTIGENSVIGAGAVVTRDIPANVVATGVPARPVRPLPADPDDGWSTPADLGL